MVGGAIALLIPPLPPARLGTFLLFTGVYLCSLAFFHLLPEGISAIGHSAKFYVLLGLALQYGISSLAGHSHTHSEDKVKGVVAIMIGLSVHAFIEGLPLGLLNGSSSLSTVVLGIAMHKIPEALLAASVLSIAYGKRAALFVLIVFSLLTPAAAFLAFRFFGGIDNINAHFLGIIICVLCGMLLFLGGALVKEGWHHSRHWPSAIVSVMLAILLSITTLA